MINIILIKFLVSIVGLGSFFFLSCGSCGKDSPEDSNINGDNSNNSEIDFFKVTALLNGNLPQEEIDKIVSPSTPIPDDITIETIVTRSDIKEYTYFFSQVKSLDSSSTSLEDDNSFSLTVPVGYEFFSLVSIDGDIIGLIKYNREGKYIANITLADDSNSTLKKSSNGDVKEYNIGSLTWNEDYFKSENSIFDIAETIYEEEGLVVNYDGEPINDSLDFEMFVTETKSLIFSVESNKLAKFSVLNLPSFCSFTDNLDNSAEISCTPELNDDGEYKGIFLWAVTENEKGHVEINLDIFKCDISLSVGVEHSCAILYNCGVKCWGYNGYGQLGLGDTNNRGDDPDEMGANLPYVDLGAGMRAKSVSTGSCHSCVILSNDSVKCWGCNDEGELNIGDNENRGDESNEMGDNLPFSLIGSNKTVENISTGLRSTCAVIDDGSIKCWGMLPVYWEKEYWHIGEYIYLGDTIYSTGDNIPAIPLGEIKSKTVLTSGDHMCAIFIDGSLKCWGKNNSNGEMGLGDTNARDVPDEMDDNLPSIYLGNGKTAVDLCVSYNTTCAILDDGNLKCWGKNDYGQLGLGDAESRGDNSNEMGDNLPSISLESDKTAIDVSCSMFHTCVVLNDGSVKCWGSDSSGSLGLGSIIDYVIGDSSDEMGENLPTVDIGSGQKAIFIGSGSDYNCVLLDNDIIKCWGNNDYGQLGIGDTVNRGIEIKDMGDNLPTVNLGVGYQFVVE